MAPPKESFSCPHCGFVQQEPAHLVSTFCRSCGSHYDVRRPATERRAASAPTRGASREVHCYRCEETHDVSVHARSTICPGCSTAIEFTDLKFSSPVSRPVDTRGRLTIKAKGSLNNSYIACGDAYIEGAINGALRCEKTARLFSSGRFACRLKAHTLVVEKSARLEFTQLVQVVDMKILGHASGDFACEGAVHIAKGGVLEGRLRARAVTVEKGGILLASSAIEPLAAEDGGAAAQPLLA